MATDSVSMHCIGSRLLKEESGASALVRFEKALMLAKFLGNKVSERRAVRGLAAASRIQVPSPLPLHRSG